MPQTLRNALADGTIGATTPSALVDTGIRHRIADFLSQEEGDGKRTAYRVAKDAGVSTNTLYRVLKSPAEPMSFEVLGKLCHALGCQPGDLLSFDPTAHQRAAEEG